MGQVHAPSGESHPSTKTHPTLVPTTSHQRHYRSPISFQGVSHALNYHIGGNILGGDASLAAALGNAPGSGEGDASLIAAALGGAAPGTDAEVEGGEEEEGVEMDEETKAALGKR